MAATNPEGNPLYSRAEDLHPLHWERLNSRDPGQAARAAGAVWDGRVFSLPLLGKPLFVDPKARQVTFGAPCDRAVGYQRALVAVAYLAGAFDAPSKDEWVAFRELPGGEAFFRGPHSLATPRLEAAFGREPHRLAPAARALGGHQDSGGDAAVRIPALPKVPFKALLWTGSDEFPPSATLLTDARAHLHVALDVLWALSNVAISDLVRASE